MKNHFATIVAILYSINILAQTPVCPDPGATQKKVASSFHSTIMIDYNGDVKYWGDGANPNAPLLTTSYILSPTTLSTSLYTGTPVAVAASSINAGGDSAYQHQLYLLTTQGLYGWGANNSRTISDINTASTSIVNMTLPAGITAANINFIASSGGGIAIVTKIVAGIGGNVYVKNAASSGGGSVYTYGDGTVATFTRTWHRVATSTGFLTNVVRLSYSQKALMAQTDLGKVFAWGEQVFTGNPMVAGNQSRAIEITLPMVDQAPLVPADINVITKTAFKVDTLQTATQFVLGANGKLYGIGDGYYGILGQGDSTDATNWVTVKDTAGGNTELSGIVQISSNNSYVYAEAYYSIGALSANGQLFLWGENSSSMLGGTSRLYLLPRVPPNFRGNKARIGYFHMGGHTTIAFLQGSNRFCYVGHLIRGSMGSGTNASTTKPSYDCINTPDAYICPPPPPLGCAAPSSNDLVASSGHATLVINGQPSVSYWGSGSSSAEAGVHVPSPRVLYEYNGTPIGVAASGINETTGSTQMWILTNEGIWGWGYSARTINDGLATAVGLTSITLPVPIANVSFIRSSRGGLAIVTKDSMIWIKAGLGSACSVNVYGDGSSSTLNSNWHQVTKMNGLFLTGVAELSFAGTAAIAITSSGVYTWGDNTYLGNGTVFLNRNRADLMTLHADFTGAMVPKTAEIIQSGTNGAAEFLLGSNGKVYSLGNNLNGVLGQGTVGGELRSWSPISTLATVRKLTSNNPYANGFYSMGALTLNGTAFLWGSNNGGMLGGGAVVSFNVPTIPTGIPAGSIAGFELGGHQAIVFPKTSNQFYFAGHNYGGSKGDSTADGNITDFTLGANVVNCAGVVYDIGGFIYNDANGIKNGLVDGAGFNTIAGIELFANLLDESGYVVGTSNIDPSTGAYLFNGFPSGNYTVQISGIKGVLFTRAPLWSLPGGWAFTGDQLGNAPNAGIDNAADGNLAIPLTGSVVNARIGFNRIPSAMAITNSTSIIAPVGTNAFALPEFSGMDPEDLPAASTLAGRSIVITALPLNGKLYYDKTILAVNAVIEAYDPGKLTLDPDNAATLVTFTYAYADAAGIKSEPAVVTLNLSYLSVTGNLLNDVNGLNDAGGGIIAGAPVGNLGGTPLFMSLVDPEGTGTILATSAVQSNGTYNFDNVVPAGNVLIVLHTTPGTLTSGGAMVASLPSGWSNSGEQQGSVAGVGMLLPSNGVAELVTSTDNLTDIYFGVEQTPVAEAVSYRINQPIPGQVIILNGSLAGNTTPPDQLTGHDPEDAPATGGLNGNAGNRTIMIKNMSGDGQLKYNNQPITRDTVIKNYNKDLLSITLTGKNYMSTGFTFAFQDLASVSSNDAAYSINWDLALPVTLLPLKVSAEGYKARLEWSTVMEQQNKGFEIQRSEDGLTWTTLGMVATKAPGGNSTTTLNYTFLDEAPGTGISYYRLKQINFDHVFQYSSIQRFSLAKNLQLSIMPNPASGQVLVSGLKKGQLLQLQDLNGRPIQQINVSNESEILNVTKLTSGAYILQVFEQGRQLGSIKFLKK